MERVTLLAGPIKKVKVVCDCVSIMALNVLPKKNLEHRY
jgi:hypothetical protein